MIGAARYFAPRYFAPHYWAKTGDVAEDDDVVPTVSANAIYQRSSDNVAPNATITVQSGTPDTAYPPANLVDLNPAKPAKIDDTAGAWLFDFGAAQRIDLVALIHHDFAGEGEVVTNNVKIQANTSDSWGSPAFEAVFSIPAWQGTGSRLWPINPWLNLTTESGYSTTGWRYWRLVIADNSQNLELGEIWMSQTIRQLDPDIRWGATRTTRKLDVEHRTAYGVTAGIVGRGTTIWQQDGEILLTDDLREDLIAQWYDVDGRVLPWLLIPDGDVNAAYLVRWATSEQQIARLYNDAHNMQVSVVEVGRGLRPGA